MAQAPQNGREEQQTFHDFFEHWIVEQNQLLQELVSASEQDEEHIDDRILSPLIERVIHHYEYYYTTKSRLAKNEILKMFNPSWRSSLEDAHLWVGGWRPSMAFHLLYSKSGLQLEARLEDLIRGISTGDLGDLSQVQLNRVNDLQKETIREEKEISEDQAKQHETVADSKMVELSHTATELMMEGKAVDEAQVETSLAPKKERMVEVLHKADDLRLKTLREVLNILTPTQDMHFLIAAAELHLRLHEWGMRRDARHHRNGESGNDQLPQN